MISRILQLLTQNPHIQKEQSFTKFSSFQNLLRDVWIAKHIYQTSMCFLLNFGVFECLCLIHYWPISTKGFVNLGLIPLSGYSAPCVVHPI